MNELLGFIVLSGPLFLILIFLLVSIVGIIILRKKVTGTKRRLLGGLSIFGITFFLLFGDEIIGKMYLNVLCKYNSGAKVLNSVELPAKYWDKNNELNIFNKHGGLKREFWLSNIGRGEGSVEKQSSFFNIDKGTTKIIYKPEGVLLGEMITYRFWGGWLRSSFSLHSNANSCEFTQDKNFEKNFYSKLFTLSNKK